MFSVQHLKPCEKAEKLVNETEQEENQERLNKELKFKLVLGCLHFGICAVGGVQELKYGKNCE